MSGPRARTNFVYNENEYSHSTPSKLLSPALTAKLQRCHLTSLQMTKRPLLKEAQEPQSPCVSSEDSTGKSVNWVSNEGQVESSQQFKSLEDDHIEQMIEELLHYGSIELCSVMQN